VLFAAGLVGGAAHGFLYPGLAALVADQAHEALEVLDYVDRPETGRPGFDRRAFLRRTALTGAAAGSVSTILAACWATLSRTDGTDDSYCPSCNRVSGCFWIGAELCWSGPRPRGR